MMKIGIIDYFLDEWHANNVPNMIKDISNGRYEVVFAYGQIDSPIGGRTNQQWSKDNGIELFDSIDEVISRSDRLMVLSPDNPEMHEMLCDLPLKSKKLVYVDKTFAPDKASAERIFAHAKANNTQCYSCSALRFANEFNCINKNEIYRLYSEGPGTYEMYSIHQIEPIVYLMGNSAKQVMFTGDAKHPSMIIEFEDGRFAYMYQTDNSPFRVTVCKEDNSSNIYTIESDYFHSFVEKLIEFFDTGIEPVMREQTIDIIAIREAGLKAMKKPFEWVRV